MSKIFNGSNNIVVMRKPWTDCGVEIEGAVSSEDALRLSGLDYNVIQKPLMECGGKKLPDLVRTRIEGTTGEEGALGYVSPRYKIVQNKEAFTFLDDLGGQGMKYEAAGKVGNGEKVWIIGKMPDHNILGDDISPYLFFTNSHDGSGSVMVSIVTLRQVCKNGMTIITKDKNAKRQFKIRHSGDVTKRMNQAQDVLGFTEKYMESFKEYLDIMTQWSVTSIQVRQIMEIVFPIDEKSKRQTTQRLEERDAFMDIYDHKMDIARFKNTAYGVYAALADLATHAESARKTQNQLRQNNNRLLSFVKDGIILDNGQKAIKQVLGM